MVSTDECLVNVPSDVVIEIVDQQKEKNGNHLIGSYKRELFSVMRFVIPIVLTYGSDYFINILQLLFIGNIAKDDSTLLAGAALGISFCNVTGFSVILGLLSALDTLISQAHGANNNQLIGRAIHQSLIVLFAICSFIIIPLWMFSGELLIVIKQDPEASNYAAQYIRTMIFALFPFTIYSILRRFLQNQGVATPLMFAGFIAVVLQIIFMILTVIVFKMGFLGVPIAQIFTNTGSCCFLIIYILWTGSYKLLLVKITKETFQGLLTWLKLGIAGMFMLCAEMWGFEINILIAGLIDKDSLAAMTLLLTVITLFYTIPLGISISATTKVGNALGSKNLEQVTIISRLVITIAFIVQCISAVIVVSTCKYWVQLFTRDNAVIEIVLETVPLLGIFTIMDAVQTTIAGILRGAGKQVWGASVYIFSYYVIGLTTGLVLVFVVNIGLRGLWLGITSASLSSMIILILYVKFFMSWPKLIEEASKRIEGNEIITKEENICSLEIQESSCEIEMESLLDENHLEEMV